MKQVYNLAGLMRKLKVDSFSELQERGYDVRSYLEQREQELADELVQRITSFFTFSSANCRYLCFYSER